MNNELIGVWDMLARRLLWGAAEVFMRHATLLIASCNDLPGPLGPRNPTAWLWEHLSQGFPDALFAVLLPRRVLLVLPPDQPEERRRALSGTLSWVKRRFGLRAGQWGRVRPGRPLEDAVELGRIIQRCALAPVRLGLVADPLEWTWSTHRDLVGAVAEPWVTPDRLAAAMARPVEGFVEGFQIEVSGRLDHGPTPAPLRLALGQPLPLETVERAAEIATRGARGAVHRVGLARTLFVHLAVAHGHSDRVELADTVGVTPRAIGHILHRGVSPVAFEAGRACLADPRLLQITAQVPAHPTEARGLAAAHG